MGTTTRKAILRRLKIKLRTAISDAGLEPPTTWCSTASCTGFGSGTKGAKAGDKSGWYAGVRRRHPSRQIRMLAHGFELPWRADVGRQFSPAEEMAHGGAWQRLALRDARRWRNSTVARHSGDDLASAQAASPEPPYPKRKGIRRRGGRA